MKKLIIDVMIMGGGKFYCQLTYSYNPLFKIDIDDVARFALEKCPSLRHRNDVVLVMDENNRKVKI